MKTRREVLQLASTLTFVGGRIQHLPREAPPVPDCYPRVGDPQLKELTEAALAAATAAGATYADIRCTLTREEHLVCGGPNLQGRMEWSDHESRHEGMLGVRVLAGGGWGFLSTTTWTRDEATRLGRDAAIQARTNGAKRRRPIEWTARPAVTGTWAAPVEIDPFTVSFAEKIDVGLAWTDRVLERYGRRREGMSVGAVLDWTARRRETTFASTEGSFITQTHYFMHPTAAVTVMPPFSPMGLSRLQPCARGWEVIADPRLYDEIPQLLEDAYRNRDAEPPSPNRYDLVCDATLVAQLLAQTVGVATELDRVLGYEANAGGTSYLAPPEDILGQYVLGSPSLNVTANRSLPGMAGTTRWDDEGTAPQEYPVIANGTVVGYHTNRELAPTLSAWDTKQGRNPESRGCATAESGRDLPVVQPPNLVMAPAPTDVTLGEMIAGLDQGLVCLGGYSPYTRQGYLRPLQMDIPLRTQQELGSIHLDRQQLNGEIRPSVVYEVRHGKRVRTLAAPQVEILFRAPDLWKNLQVVGGVSTQCDAGFETWKGEPNQSAAFGVRACAARFKQVVVTDASRKA